MCLSCPLGSVLAKNAESRRHLPDGQKTIPRVSPVFILFGGCSRGQCSPCLARTQSLIVHGKIPSPACGGRWPQAGRGEYKTSIYPAWQLLTNPVFIPLDDRPQTRCLSRLARAKSRTLYGKNPFPRLRGKVAAGRKGGIQNQHLSRLAATHKPSVYHAWSLPTNPVVITLDGFH